MTTKKDFEASPLMQFVSPTEEQPKPTAKKAGRPKVVTPEAGKEAMGTPGIVDRDPHPIPRKDTFAEYRRRRALPGLEPRSKQWHIMIRPSLYNAIETYAQARHFSTNSMLEWIVGDYVAKYFPSGQPRRPAGRKRMAAALATVETEHGADFVHRRELALYERIVTAYRAAGLEADPEGAGQWAYYTARQTATEEEVAAEIERLIAQDRENAEEMKGDGK